MKALRWFLADPTGNLTILVETPVPAAEQPSVAAALCRLEPRCEQVGFLSGPDPDGIFGLRMAGGEFCGNAAMSAAAHFVLRGGPAHGVTQRAVLRVSGAAAPVSVLVTVCGPDTCRAEVEMPRPRRIVRLSSPLPGLAGSFYAAEFDGITHILLPAAAPRQLAEREIAPCCARLGAAALGLMLFDEARGSLAPLVYVPGAGTLCWERSCASGTAAVGACLAAREGHSVRLSLSEPGGVLRIAADYETGAVTALRLGGGVKLFAPRELVLP